MLKGKKFDAFTLAPNLYFMKSNLDFMEYKLGIIVCSRLLQVLS